MIRAAAVIVLLALTAPSVAVLACELVACAGEHHAASARPEDCHDHEMTEAGPAWSGTASPCHRPADALAVTVVTTGSTPVTAPSALRVILAPVLSTSARSHALPRSGQGPPASLHATAQLRI